MSVSVKYKGTEADKKYATKQLEDMIPSFMES